MPRHIIIKFLKIRGKEKVLKAAREKNHLILREKLFPACFSPENMGVKRKMIFFLFLVESLSMQDMKYQPGIKPAVEGQNLTTGLPGNFQI